ncbi:MAG: glycosyltransferase [Terriglobia bacterium]
MRFRTEVTFFTSTQARDRFQARFPSMRCHWIPDGSSPELHVPDKPLTGRRIDVLEVGRRYDRYHDAISTCLVRMKAVHLFEQPPGQIVFSDRDALIQGLADSRIVVCFPSSITIPARAAIETITPRYFEAMASGCLIVGHCPADLKQLFGYNPVIEADMDNAAGQIGEIIRNIESYKPLVEKNLTTIKGHTWLHRAIAIRRILEAQNLAD